MDKNIQKDNKIKRSYRQEFSKRVRMSYSDYMSETGQLGQIRHSWAALKKEPFLYVFFIPEDVFDLHKKVYKSLRLCVS